MLGSVRTSLCSTKLECWKVCDTRGVTPSFIVLLQAKLSIDSLSDVPYRMLNMFSLATFYLTCYSVTGLCPVQEG